MSGLYLHVPFCLRKCRYCDFYSRTAATSAVTDRYLTAVARELALLPAGFQPSSVFIGGGTPSVLARHDLARLLAAIRDAVDLSRVDEWSCEVNPGTLTPAKAAELVRGGVTRVSVGAQSFSANTLRFLGRPHGVSAIGEAFGMLRGAGIRHLSIDLIYGCPGSGPEDLARDIDRAMALHPEHVSAYLLTLEDGTPLAGERDRGAFVETDDREAARQYRTLRRTLTGAGFDHYEISNFARPGCACRHNLLYWSGGEYLGIGPAAHSHWNGRRWANVADLDRYTAALEKGRRARSFDKEPSPEERAAETLVFSLRQVHGLDREAFRAQTGFDILALRGEAIRRLVEEKLLVLSGRRLRLSRRALFISDTVFAALI